MGGGAGHPKHWSLSLQSSTNSSYFVQYRCTITIKKTWTPNSKASWSWSVARGTTLSWSRSETYNVYARVVARAHRSLSGQHARLRAAIARDISRMPG
eukprot:scaffold28955_cov31-Tisochrysis_lutea.AAC.1